MGEVKYRIHPAVTHFTQGDRTVVYNTMLRAVFEYTAIAGDILGCFEESAGIEDAVARVVGMYAIEDEPQFREDIACFVEELCQEGNLVKEGPLPEPDDAIERDIAERFERDGRLGSVTMELTYRCNERCRHCYIVGEQREEMSTDQVKAVLDELAEMGVVDITFTGGELFTRPDAFEILEHARRKRFVVDVFTNGTTLTGDDCIRLKALWPRCVHFSVYSHMPEKHDAVTRVPGSFEKTLAAIRRCVAIGIPVNIKAPIFAETQDDVGGLAELARSLGTSIELGSNVTPRKDGDLAPTRMEVAETDMASCARAIADAIGAKPDLALIRKPGLICRAGVTSLSISPYGDVFPCVVFPLRVGNVTESAMREIWESSEQLRWWRENNRSACRVGCEGCVLADACAFCPGEAMVRAGSPLARYEKACRDTRCAGHRARKGA